MGLDIGAHVHVYVIAGSGCCFLTIVVPLQTHGTPIQKRKAEREERLRRRFANEFKTSTFQTVRLRSVYCDRFDPPSPSDRPMFESVRPSVSPRRFDFDGPVPCHHPSHSLFGPFALHTHTQITKTDKIKAMSKKQLRQIKKTQVRSTHIRDRHAAVTTHPVATRQPNQSDRTAHSHPTNSHTNTPDEPAGRGGAGLAVGQPGAGRAARATEEALG